MTRLSSKSKLKIYGLVIGFVSTIATSCKPFTSLTSRSQPTSDPTTLTLQVQPAEKPGEFNLTGTADLPTGTELHVMAIRQLRLKNAPLLERTAQPTYSVLDYDNVVVERDRWQTNLFLWEVAPNGDFKEPWQLQAPDLKLAVEPEAEVIFLVTLSPLYDLAAIERQLAQQDQQLTPQLIQTTADGQRFLQTGQALAIALPTGRTSPIAWREEDANGGWGNRYLELPDLPNERQLEMPEQRQTNAPVTPSEFLY